MAISLEDATQIASNLFAIIGDVSKLPGDEDFNFKIKTATNAVYLLKISEGSTSKETLVFQNELLAYLAKKEMPFQIPKTLPNKDGKMLTSINIDNKKYYVRLISFVKGRIWKDCNPKTNILREDLGRKIGVLTKTLQNFNDNVTPNTSDWDLANVAWTRDYITLFSEKRASVVTKFQTLFTAIESTFYALPKSSIHGDINDQNIVLSNNLNNLEVAGIFDFGDATHTQTVNEIAITIAYAAMEVPDPLEAALDILRGYATQHTLTEKEIECLYTLVAMRLLTTVTKTAIRKKEDMATSYHLISEQPAWDLLEKWNEIHPDYALYSFRNIFGYEAHPNKTKFENWAAQHTFNFSELFPSEILKNDIYLLDLKLSSTWIGSRHEFNNLELFEFKINQLQKEHPTKFIADGYLEPRPIYTSTAYDKEGNTGTESRTVHLGVDFWLPAGTPVHTMFDAEVVTAVNDAGYKEYGGLIILKHIESEIPFYTLYGHLSIASPMAFQVGDRIKKGTKIGELGIPEENGEWSPHLHFQVMLTMFDYKIDFPGVTYPKQLEVWKSICPDPNLIFKNPNLVTAYDKPASEILHFRRKHLGKSLSVSYKEPLHIVRGDGTYLIDTWGAKYLDTVNNVAHVGHEHPAVVKAAQTQMAVLNTNTRYLNAPIIEYTKALLKKLPPELSVLHFVNSGSEATELALRMARTITKQKEILAIEVGYHGNTTAAMEVSSYKFDSKGGGGKPENTHILPLPDPFRGRHADWGNMGSKYASYAQRHIDHLALIDEGIAGFIGESILSCGGQIVPPEGYLKEIYKIVRAAGGLCIADEVQTGFGRIGSHFWAFEMHDVVPDIVTMGKPAGNGHPLAIVACTEEVANAFANGLEFFNTFGGNPVSCAIGKTVIDVIEVEKLQQNAKEVGDFLLSELKKLQQNSTCIGDIRGSGFFLGIELTDSSKKPLPEHASYLVNRMKDFNILMSTDGPDHNVLKIKPPMVFNIDNAKELIFRLQQVLQEDFMTHY